MSKRVKHFISVVITCAIITVVLAITMPREADALPVAWRGTPKFTRAGVTYRVRDDIHAAVVVRTKDKRVTIPAEVKHGGKWYEVRAIWPEALKGARVVTIHADLECIESARVWAPDVKVRVTRTGMYRWLKRTGANVTRVRCPHCK